MEAGLPRGVVVSPGWVYVHFDGACQPPRGGGVATYGFTVDGHSFQYEDRGLAVAPGSPLATNNVAEYVAAIRALEWLQQRGFGGLVLARGDSQLVVRQMQGTYRIRAEHLKAYYRRLTVLTKRFDQVRFEWIPREENSRADALSKQALTEVAAEARRVRNARSPFRPR